MTERAANALHVVAGALIDPAGRVLIADRPSGKSFAGRWEFPGGKCLPGEPAGDALKRELVEELGIEVTSAEPLMTVTHCYAAGGATVRIECWRVDAWRGTPQGLDGQQLRWCTREELATADILEADRSIVTALRLPRLFVHVGAGESLAMRAEASAARDRAAWILPALPDDAALAARLLTRGDSLCVIDPVSAVPAGTVVVHGAPARCTTPPLADTLVGCVVSGAEEAAEAARRGVAFLLVRERVLDRGEFRGIAATGLPWYLNVAVRAAEAAPAATGTLWWKAEVAALPA